MKAWSRIEKGSFWAYVVWMAIGLITMPLQWTESRIAEWTIFEEGHYSGLQWFLGLCLRNGNPVLMCLAALNTYLMLIRHWGLSAARRWALIVMAVTGIVEMMGTQTGRPFGPYVYTDQMGGMILGILPVSIPLAWLVVVSCFLIGIRSLYPAWSKVKVAVAVGILTMGFDYVMEPFATRAMGFWLWSTPDGLPPIQNYLAWFGLSFFLVWRFASMRLDDESSDIRPPTIIGSMLALFILVRIAHGI